MSIYKTLKGHQRRKTKREERKIAFPPCVGYTVKKRLAVFLSQGGMSLAKLSMTGNNLIIPGQGKVLYVTSRQETGKPLTFFLQCSSYEASILSLFRGKASSLGTTTQAIFTLIRRIFHAAALVLLLSLLIRIFS